MQNESWNLSVFTEFLSFCGIRYWLVIWGRTNIVYLVRFMVLYKINCHMGKICHGVPRSLEKICCGKPWSVVMSNLYGTVGLSYHIGIEDAGVEASVSTSS